MFSLVSAKVLAGAALAVVSISGVALAKILEPSGEMPRVPAAMVQSVGRGLDVERTISHANPTGEYVTTYLEIDSPARSIRGSVNSVARVIHRKGWDIRYIRSGSQWDATRDGYQLLVQSAGLFWQEELADPATHAWARATGRPGGDVVVIITPRYRFP